MNTKFVLDRLKEYAATLPTDGFRKIMAILLVDMVDRFDVDWTNGQFAIYTDMPDWLRILAGCPNPDDPEILAACCDEARTALAKELETFK